MASRASASGSFPGGRHRPRGRLSALDLGSRPDGARGKRTQNQAAAHGNSLTAGAPATLPRGGLARYGRARLVAAVRGTRLRRDLGKFLQRRDLPLAARHVRGPAAEYLPELSGANPRALQCADPRLPVAARSQRLLRRCAVPALSGGRSAECGAVRSDRATLRDQRRGGHHAGARRAECARLFFLRGWSGDRHVRGSRVHGDPGRGLAAGSGARARHRRVSRTAGRGGGCARRGRAAFS